MSLEEDLNAQHDRDLQRATSLLNDVAAYLDGLDWDVSVAIESLKVAFRAVEAAKRGSEG